MFRKNIRETWIVVSDLADRLEDERRLILDLLMLVPGIFKDEIRNCKLPQRIRPQDDIECCPDYFRLSHAILMKAISDA